MVKKLLAEGIGTFVLAFVVLGSVTGSSVIPTPVIAGLVVMLFVYTIGWLSGCHLNPAVTIGVLSIGKIKPILAVQYIVSQFIGALLALLVVLISGTALVPILPVEPAAIVFELLGTAILTFGIAAVVFDKEKSTVSGFLIGGSLILGATVAGFGGAAGILNPAVGVALQSTVLLYYLAEIVGGILGFQLYSYFMKSNSK